MKLKKATPRHVVVEGRYLIERTKDECWDVWDMEVLFSSQHQSFSCETEREARELCAHLMAMETL